MSNGEQSPRDERGARASSAPERFAVIVGTGFAGLCVAIALKRAGIEDFVLLEKAATVGGTWRDNHYPGCACDVPSHVYSLSFAPNPRWSETYAPQAEIRAYLEDLVDKFGLRDRIVFESEATSARYDEASARWTVETANGQRITSRIVIGALGPLSRWSFPKLSGLERFEGAKFHSAAWDHSFDPKGKRVASIGTGASAIQYVPELAKSAARLHVFQRTPAWVLPRYERKYSEAQKRLFERVPAAGRAFREALFWQQEARAIVFVRNEGLRARAERLAAEHIRKAIKDPALRAKLEPSYRLGCKRILLSNTYYPALAQPNVEVVTDGIREVTARGIIANDGVERPVDAIVFGTGFDVHDYLGRLSVTGRDGEDLGARWAREGAKGYLGTVVSGFPNLFFLVGPNTGLGHNSILYMIECQARIVVECALRIARGERTTVEVREAVQRRYNDDIQRMLQDTVWNTGGCASWYLDAHGRNSTLWPGYCYEFKRATEAFSLEDCVVREGPAS
jgi:cation diffusion facilitator CzcD-associated flavoprotein CzcO